MQTLVRCMPDLHKTLVLVNAKVIDGNNNRYHVDELAFTTEHAPFRHRPKPIEIKVGAQKKTNTNHNKKSKVEGEE